MKHECRKCGRKFRSIEKKTKHETDCGVKQSSIKDAI